MANKKTEWFTWPSYSNFNINNYIETFITDLNSMGEIAKIFVDPPSGFT